jgi:hypothetical protein
MSDSRITAFLDRAERDKFYGSITVRYEAGRPMTIRREETILAKDLTTNGAKRTTGVVSTTTAEIPSNGREQ